MKVLVSKANTQGQKMAVLTMGAKDVAKLLLELHWKLVGWGNGVWEARRSYMLQVSGFWECSQSLQMPRQKQVVLQVR